MPANEASWDDLQTIFGTRGPGARCFCQRYKLRPREYEGLLRNNRVPWDNGTEGVFAAAGFTEVGRPTLRRVVMRIDY